MIGDDRVPEGQEDFAPKFHKEGDTVEGAMVAIGLEVAFVDAGGLTLSHKLARGAVTRQPLDDAFRAWLPVDGRVEKAIKGGYEVKVAGETAFCPIPQIDTSFTADPSVHVGTSYTFRIIESKEDGKELVVSRRRPARPCRVGARIRRLHRQVIVFEVDPPAGGSISAVKRSSRPGRDARHASTRRSRIRRRRRASARFPTRSAPPCDRPRNIWTRDLLCPMMPLQLNREQAVFAFRSRPARKRVPA